MKRIQQQASFAVFYSGDAEVTAEELCNFVALWQLVPGGVMNKLRLNLGVRGKKRRGSCMGNIAECVCVSLSTSTDTTLIGPNLLIGLLGL